jgi:hypothetical protein
MQSRKEHDMKTYEISWYEDGVKHHRIVKANSKDEALKIGWSLVDADSLYVSEVTE